MAKVQLSARVKKLSKDFAIVDGKLQMPFDKMHAWMGELEKVPAGERAKLAEELVALAIRFEREGKEGASIATAQLYAFAAGALNYSGQEAAKGPSKGKSATKPAAKSGGGWSAKSKR
jgi:hypothetical protein